VLAEGHERVCVGPRDDRCHVQELPPGGKATPKRGAWHCQLIFGAPARILPEPSNNRSSHASLYLLGVGWAETPCATIVVARIASHVQPFKRLQCPVMKTFRPSRAGLPGRPPPWRDSATNFGGNILHETVRVSGCPGMTISKCAQPRQLLSEATPKPLQMIFGTPAASKQQSVPRMPCFCLSVGPETMCALRAFPHVKPLKSMPMCRKRFGRSGWAKGVGWAGAPWRDSNDQLWGYFPGVFELKHYWSVGNCAHADLATRPSSLPGRQPFS